MTSDTLEEKIFIEPTVNAFRPLLGTHEHGIGFAQQHFRRHCSSLQPLASEVVAVRPSRSYTNLLCTPQLSLPLPVGNIISVKKGLQPEDLVFSVHLRPSSTKHFQKTLTSLQLQVSRCTAQSLRLRSYLPVEYGWP